MKFSPQEYSVAVVSVTYGHRSHYVRELLYGLDSGIVRPMHCIIVDNGSKEDLDAVCADANTTFNTTVLHQGSNTGSAAGFSAGIRLALELNYDYVWLLDDDNVPEPEALAILQEQLQREGEVGFKTCLAGLRLDRTKYIRAAAGEPTMSFSAPDSFMGFSLARSLLRRLYPEPSGGVGGGTSADTRLIDVAIYGGLMIPASAIKSVGLPNELFFLYLDDREFSTRLTRAGFHIKLVPQARIKDLEDSWATHDGKKIPWVFNLSASSSKVYYTLRNGVHYDRCFVVNHTLLYLLNAVVFLTISFLIALLRGVSPLKLWLRCTLVWSAFQDGWRGHLGKVIAHDFEHGP